MRGELLLQLSCLRRTTPFVRERKDKENHGDRRREAAPEQRPARHFFRGAGGKPPAAAEVAERVAEAAVHEREQRLCACAPCGFDALFEVDLRGDEEERECEAVHGDAGEERDFSVERAGCGWVAAYGDSLR